MLFGNRFSISSFASNPDKAAVVGVLINATCKAARNSQFVEAGLIGCFAQSAPPGYFVGDTGNCETTIAHRLIVAGRVSSSHPHGFGGKEVKLLLGRRGLG